MKKTLLLLATLACAAALYLGYQYSKTLTPETVLQELFDMNAPARYAFISDADAPKLAVIDLETSRQTSLLDLKQPARNLTIHKTLGLLAYNDGGTTVTIRQLGDHSEKNHTLAHPVTRLQFDADSPWLIAGGADRLPGTPIAGRCAQYPGTGLACRRRLQRTRGRCPAREW